MLSKVSTNCSKCYIPIIYPPQPSVYTTACWLSRLINLNWRFPQAAFPSSNERQVPVKVGAILPSNMKIEAFSSLSGAWRGLEGWLLRPAATTCFACSRCHWCPFFGACRVFKSLAMPLMPSLIFRICTGSIRSTDFKAPAPLTCCWSPFLKCFQSLTETKQTARRGRGGTSWSIKTNTMRGEIWQHDQTKQKCFSPLEVHISLHLSQGKERQQISNTLS